MPTDVPGCLAELSAHAARRFGERSALICGDASLSFAEIDRVASRIANVLKALGIEPGARVTLHGGNGWRWVAAYHGIAKTGAAINPLNPMLTAEEVAHAAADCGARAILTGPEMAAAMLELRSRTALEHVIVLEGACPAGALRLDDLLSRAKPRFAPARRAPGELAAVCYTSGTTGRPKGAMQSHRAVLTAAANAAALHGRGPDSVAVTALPCAHVYGAFVMNACFLGGGRLVLLARFEEKALLSAMERHRASIYDGVPTAYLRLLAEPRFEAYDLSSLAALAVGGQTFALARAEEVEARFGAPLIEHWGMTELAGPGTSNALCGPRRLGSIGMPCPGVECRIASLDDPTETLGCGEPGELMVRGTTVFEGYFGDDAASEAAFASGGWLHSGDIARRDEDGFFHIVDRKKDMIVTAGYNIYPAEIERVLAEHPAIAMCGVGAKPDPLKGEIAKAYVVLKPGARADQDEIDRYCRRHLAAYKVPREVQFVDDLPKTATGKVLRRALARLDR